MGQWFRDNDLSINVKKTKMVGNFRKDKHPFHPLVLGEVAMDVLSKYSYLGVCLSSDQTWCANPSCRVRRAPNHLGAQRELSHCEVKSILCTSMWHSSCTAADMMAA